VHAFEILADPVRRFVVELLAEGERTAGELTDRVQAEFGISQPAVSRHLRVLREAGFAGSEPRAQQRLYRLHPEPLAEVDAWLARYRPLWSQALDALDTEIHRGRRAASPGPPERGPS
jgi:DNA-binding transcriptional ArsR family regulator